MYILKKVPRNQKTFSPLMTTFYNFALKIETNWAKKVVKPILETLNAASDVVYVWLIHSLIKKFKNMQCEKEKF